MTGVLWAFATWGAWCFARDLGGALWAYVEVLRLRAEVRRQHLDEGDGGEGPDGAPAAP